MGQIVNRRRVFGGEGGIADYMTFVSLADGNVIKFFASDDNNTRSIDVSTNGRAWETKTSSTTGATLATLNNGQKLYVRGVTSSYSNGTYYHYFEATEYFALQGNIMSLLYGDNFIGQTALPSGTYTFYSMFSGCSTLVDITNLVMPATTLMPYCYYRMFMGTGITSLPENLLPATTLQTACYQNMFYGTSITEIPSGFLPATTLAGYCYFGMFEYVPITTLPSGLLPATTLADSCYREMFYHAPLITVPSDLMSNASTLASNCCRAMFSGCTSLRNSPDLNAATLVTECYRVMFNGCTSITYIKCIATSISASNATTSWLGGASSTGTFVRASGVNWARSTSGIPSGWTIQNA